jgi:L-tartrate/succinate antiporter
VRKTVGVEITWIEWFVSFAPVGMLLLLALPWLVYLLYPPTIKQGTQVATWAADQLHRMGAITRREAALGALVLLALLLWIFGGNQLNPTTTALAVVGLMLLTRIVSWDDVLTNKHAWATLVWFATLIPLADGLNRTGFVSWFATSVGGNITGVAPTLGMIVLVSAYFLSHYFFASVSETLSDADSVRRDHGHSHSVCRRPEPGVLRQWVPPGPGLLAPRSHLRLCLFRCVAIVGPKVIARQVNT